jgi:uncharacterized protein YbjQ (UPF0145 family)
MLVMTIDQVPGHRVRRILGEVIGVTIRSDNPYVEGVKSLNGEGDERVGQLIATRQEAVASMIEYARRLGANAIVEWGPERSVVRRPGRADEEVPTAELAERLRQ